MVSPLATLPSDAYVPILKGKAAELGAVSSAPKDRLVPLLEFIDAEKAPALLSKAWDTEDDAVWVQLLNFEGVSDSDFGTQITAVFDQVRGKVCAVPVVTTTEEPATLAAIAGVIAEDQRGAVLRIDVEDLIDGDVDTGADIASTLDQLDISPSQVALVVDGGTLTGPPTIQATVATQALSALTLDDWLSVILSFSAFPEELGKIAAASSVTVIPRADAVSFTTVRNTTEHALIYGDYAVGTPSYGAAPFAPIPNIRYAAGGDWQIHRARTRKSPSPQYVALAKAIVSATYYDGASFSPGDQQINDVATGAGGPGNATTHLRAATSRHLHLVLSRLASLGAP
jgi:hypothetical protein